MATPSIGAGVGQTLVDLRLTPDPSESFSALARVAANLVLALAMHAGVAGTLVDVDFTVSSLGALGTRALVASPRHILTGSSVPAG